MARPLPNAGFPGGIPITRPMAMPEAPTDNIYGTLGQVAQNVGQDIMNYEQQQYKRGQDDIETQRRRAMLDEMILKRKQAQDLAQARADWEAKKLDLEQAKMNQKKLQDEEANKFRTEKSDREKEKHDQEQKQQEAIQNFNKDLLEARKNSRETGTQFTKEDAEDIAEAYGISGSEHANRIMNRWWPNYRPSTAGATQENKKNTAKIHSQYLESELQILLDKLSQITKQPYEASRIIQDPYSMEKELMKVPQEMRKQSDINALEKELRGKISQINKNKAIAGISPEDENQSEELNSLMGEINAIKESIAKKEQELNSLRN